MFVPSSLKEVIITGGTSIGEDAFESCTSLTSITIQEGVTSIGEDAFFNCTSLTSITIPESVTSIGYSAFNNCTSLTSITIPESVTSIGSNAFYNCTSLTSITIPESVTSIGSFAFYYCTSLTSITIPESVTSIGDFAFKGCENLKTVYNISSLPIRKDSISFGFIGYYATNVYKMYSVSFNVNDEIEKEYVIEGEKVVKPDDPVKEAYEFTGWYLDGEVYDFESSVISNIILIAKFDEMKTE